MNGEANPNDSKTDSQNVKILPLVTVSWKVSSTKLSNSMIKELLLVYQ